MNKQTDDKKTLPKCGFGLTGLCCQACLLGPCRCHPLEPENTDVDCGKAPGVLVASRLLRLLTWETLETTGGLMATASRLVQSGAEVPDEAETVWRKTIARKYLDPAQADSDQLAAHLKTWAEKLISPVFSGDEFAFEIGKMYPSRIFPLLAHEKIRLNRSLVQDLFDSVSGAVHQVEKTDDILWRCLKMALLSMVAGEIDADLKTLFDTGKTAKTQSPDANRPDSSPPGGSFDKKGLVIVSDAVATDPLHAYSRDFQQKTDRPFVRVDGRRSLTDLLRDSCQEGAPERFHAETVAVIFSASAVDVLIPLILGFNTTSFPPLPLYGSKEVEIFFRETLKQHMGVSYLPAHSSDMTAAIQALQGSYR